MTPDRPDLSTLRDDDRLLDRLGRGERAEGDVEELLAGWRAGLPAAPCTDPRLLAACTAAVTGKRRRRGRTTRASLTAAAVALIAGGTVTVAAASAEPDSPLWPVTRVVYGDLAESRVARDGASDAVSEARAEVDQGHYPEAERLLDVADSLVAKVHEPADVRRLRQDIATVRGLLPTPQLPGTSSAKAPINPAPATPDDREPRDRGRDHDRDRRSPDEHDRPGEDRPGEDDGGRWSDGDRNDHEDDGGGGGDDGQREKWKERPNAFRSVPEVEPTSLAEPGR